MNIFAIWIATIIGSFVADFSNELNMYKDLADMGYKRNSKKIYNISKSQEKELLKQSLLTLLIPGLNIYEVAKRIITYQGNKGTCLESLRVMGLLDEMTDFEKEIYNQKPTKLNAFLAPIKAQLEISKCKNIKFLLNENDNEKSTIYYRIVDKKLVIITSTGPVSSLSKEEQEKVFNKKIKELSSEIKSTLDILFNEMENLQKWVEKEKSNGNTNIDLNKYFEERKTKLDNNPNNKPSTSEKIEKLENFKQEIITNNTNSVTQNNENEKGNSKTLK